MGKIRGEIGGEITGTVGDVTISTWKGIKVAKRTQKNFPGKKFTLVIMAEDIAGNDAMTKLEGDV